MISEAEKKLFNCLIQRPAIANKNEFVYTAGYTGYDFLDLSRLTLSPKTSGKVVEMYVDLLEELKKDYNLEFNKLAFIERTIGPMTIASQLSQRTGLESVVIKSRIPCSCSICTKLRIKGSIEPPLSEDDRVVIISDVLTTGGTISDTVDIIEKNGASVVAAVTILDRQVPDEQAKKKKEIVEKGVKLHSLTTRDKLLAFGFARPSEEDFKQKDFLKILEDELSLTNEERKEIEEVIFLEAAYILDVDEETIKSFGGENLLELKNILLSRIFRARTTMPLITEVLTDREITEELK